MKKILFLFASLVLFPPVLAFADGSQTFSLSGTFTVPAYGTLTVTVNGPDGGGASGTETSSPITAQTIYTITCRGFPGATPATASDSTTVNIAPSFQEK